MYATQQIKDQTPTPNKNSSYGIKGGVRVPYFWVHMPHVAVGNTLILTDLYAIRIPKEWHVLGAYCLQIWGVGVVRIVSYTIAAKIITKKLFTIITFRGNQFCNYYKSTLHSARKI